MAILLLGGRGKTSIRIASLLSAAEVPFLLASRTTSPTVPYQQAHFDWLDELTWGQPFTLASSEKGAGGISTVYIVAPTVMNMVPPMQKFIDFAWEKGVKRFVLLSSSALERGGPAMGSVHGYLADLGEKVDGFEWTVLRPSWFMENMSEAQYLTTIKNDNKIYTATGEGKIPFISADDIARVAFRALTDDHPHNTDHIILGPELLSYDQVAEILSSVLDIKVSHTCLSESELMTFLSSTIGIPEDFATMLAGLDSAIANGAENRMNSVVEQVTGEPPRTFRAFADKECWA